MKNYLTRLLLIMIVTLLAACTTTGGDTPADATPGGGGGLDNGNDNIAPASPVPESSTPDNNNDNSVPDNSNSNDNGNSNETPVGGQPSLTFTPSSGSPGTPFQLMATGLPPNAEVEIGLGPVDSEFEIFDSAQTDDAGVLNREVTLPDWLDVNGEWVFVIDYNQGEVRIISDPFTVTGVDEG